MWCPCVVLLLLLWPSEHLLETPVEWSWFSWNFLTVGGRSSLGNRGSTGNVLRSHLFDTTSSINQTITFRLKLLNMGRIYTLKDFKDVRSHRSHRKTSYRQAPVSTALDSIGGFLLRSFILSLIFSILFGGCVTCTPFGSVILVFFLLMLLQQ